MSAFFLAYRIWFQIGAIVVLVGGCVWGVHAYNEHFRELGRAEVRTEWAAADVASEKAAREKEAMWNKRIEEANENWRKRNEAQTAALAAATAANGSLSGSLARVKQGAANATPAALVNTVTALSAVFGDCATKYIGMAEVAGRHANDIQRILDQWPKNEVAKP